MRSSMYHKGNLSLQKRFAVPQIAAASWANEPDWPRP